VSVETPTYAALGARLKILPAAVVARQAIALAALTFGAKPWCVAIPVLSFPSSAEQS
jgi:hypothetical protein